VERVRFGLFDFDPATGDLRREGITVSLQPQPAQVLALLVERAGEVVTRETLQRALWGAETFVDFERGLNFCIGQVRAALDDSAESPRFIRTIPKRGYQFIAPVSPAVIRPVSPRFAPRGAVLAGIVGVIGLLVVVIALRGRIFGTANPAEPVSIAIVRFDNETGSPELDRFAGDLTDAVVAEMTGALAGRFGVIGNAAILRRPRQERDLVDIASSLNAGYVVLGQVQRNGSGVRVLTHLIRMPGQTHVWVARTDSDAGKLIGAQSDVAHHIVTEFAPRLIATQGAPR